MTRERTLLPGDLEETEILGPSGNVLFSFQNQPPPPAAPPPEPAGLLGGSLKRGALNTASDFTNTAGMFAEAVLSPEYAESFYAKADEYSNRAEAYQARIGRVENINSPGDLATFAFEVLVENASMIASLAIPGGAVAKGVQIAGASKKAQGLAGVAASFTANIGLQTGESTSIARDAGKTPVDLRVVGSGLGKAVLDFVPLLGLAKRFGLAKSIPFPATLEKMFVKTLADKRYIRRVAGHSGAIMAQEIPTEVSQELLNIALDRALREHTGDFTGEEISQLKNAAAGAAAFGLLGFGAGVRRVKEDPKNREETPEGLDVDPELLPTLYEGTDPGPEPDSVSSGFETFAVPPSVAPESRQIELLPIEGEFEVMAPGIESLESAGPVVKIPSTETTIEDNPSGVALPQQGDLWESLYAYSSGEFGSAKSRDPMLEVDEEPVSVGGLPPTLDEISQGLNYTAEQLKVALLYPQYLNIDKDSAEAQVTASLHPGLQRLFGLRDDLINDEGSYRTTDGVMKVNESKKLAAVEKKIEVLQERLGIKHSTVTEPVTQEVVDKPVENARGPAPVVPEEKMNRIDVLLEKEQFDGLTDKEYEELTILQEYVTGERSLDATRPQTKEEIAELDKMATEAIESETVRRNNNKLYREKEAETGVTLTAEMAQGILAKFTKKFIFGPKIKIITKDSDIYKMEIFKAGGPVRGWFNPSRPGEVYIVADNHTNSKDLIITYLHETLAHYGLRTVLNAKELGAFLTALKKVPRVSKTGASAFPPSAITHAHFRGTHSFNSITEAENYLYDLQEEIENIRRGKEGSVLDSLSENTEPTSQDIEDAVRMTEERIAELDEQIHEAEFVGYALSEAEEYVADLAERVKINAVTGEVEMSALQKIIAILRRALRRLFSDLKFSDSEIIDMLRTVSRGLTGAITQSNPAGHGSEFSTETLFRIMGNRKAAEEVSSGIANLGEVWGARFAKMFYTPLQFAKKYKVPGADEFLNVVEMWWARKRILTKVATQIGESWTKFGKKDQKKIADLALHISIESDEKGRRLREEELQVIFKDLGVADAEALQQIWRDMDQSFRDIIQQFKTSLQVTAIRMQSKTDGFVMSMEDAKKLNEEFIRALNATPAERAVTYKKLGHATWTRLQDIQKETVQLENRNYFPRMRFGKHIVTFRANKDLSYRGKKYRGPVDGKRGAVVYFEAFDGRIEADKFFRESLEGEFKDKTLYDPQIAELSDQQKDFMGVMSPQLFESLMGTIPSPTNENEEAMTAQMKQQLKDIYMQQAPGRNFLRHLLKRRGVAGYSQDVMRVYASYMMNISNHIARLEFNIDMQEQLKVIETNAKNVVPDARIASTVLEFFQKQHKYLMNPESDLSQLRSLGFLWYLGFNVKSAAVNLTQVPMVAYPYLASIHGDKASLGAILSAMKMVTKNRTKGEMYPGDLAEMVQRGVDEGFIEESAATELAALGENSVLQRMIAETVGGVNLSKISYYGAFLFQKAERINREITFIAAYNLATSQGKSKEVAFYEGRRAVSAAMFEYAKWNRPEFMRGKKSVFFLFWQYIQGLSFIAFGGEGRGAAMRVWVMLLLAGGLQGLPFAENFLDLADFVGTKSKEAMGLKDPKLDLRHDLRSLAMELTDRPDMIMHGLSRYYGAGPLHMLSMFGLPVPNVDISGSLSAGRVIPGIDDITSPSRDPNAKLGRAVVSIAGPRSRDSLSTMASHDRTEPGPMESLGKNTSRCNEKCIGRSPSWI